MSNRGGAPGVGRARLIRRLDELAARTLTLIVGPAGAGKTTLLDHWATGRPQVELVRVAVDSSSVEPLFVDLARGLGDPDELQRVLEADPVADAVIGSYEQQAARIGNLHVVVDCGVVTLSADQTAFLDRLANTRSPHLHLVLAARAMPELALGHLITSGRLGVIAADELAFGVDEVRSEAEAALGRHVDIEEATRVHAETAGWVVAVLAVIDAATRAADPAARLGVTGALDEIDRFVAREVIDRLDEPLRTFLFEVAELEQIHPTMCDEILGRDDSGELIARLERSLGFIEQLDVGSYRLDPLVQACLRRITRSESPETAHRIAEAASAYHERRGDRLEAAANLVALERYDEAIDQLRVFSMTSLSAHDLRRVRVLVDEIPGDAFRGHPQGLQTLASLLLILRDDAAARVVIAELEASVDESSDESWATRVFVHGAQVTRAPWRLDPAEALADVDAVLALLGDVPEGVPTGLDSPPFVWTRTVVAQHGAQVLFRLGRFAEARIHAEAVREVGDRLPTAAARMWSLCALIAATVGDLGAVEADARRAEQLVRQNRPDRSSVTADAEIARVVVALEQDRLPDAGAALARIAEMQEFPHPPATAARLAVLQARWALARGELRSGLIVCDRLRRSLPDGVPVDSRAALAAVEVRLALRYGQAGHARRLLANTPPGRESHAVAALVHWMDRDHHAVATDLGTWPSSPCVVNRIEYLVFRALQADHASRSADRHRYLLDAARAAQPAGFTRVFLDTAPGVVDLLVNEVRRTHDPDPALVALVERLAPSVGGSVAVGGPEFSAREASIVALLPTHLSGVEIAERLGISPSTLKSHLQRIYRKLRVHTRSDAVDRLRGFGIIESPE